MSAAPPPGWYPDNGGTGQRFWDGQQWTDHVAPGGTQVPPADGGAKRNWVVRHKILSAVIAFFLFIMIVGAVGGGNEDLAPAAADTNSQNSGGSVESPVADESTPAPVDTDGDGVIDDDDLRPNDPNISTLDDLDTDGDGVRDGDDFQPNNPKVKTQDDVDTDKDGVPDYKDDFRNDARYSKDTDGDRVADQLDDFPKDARYSKDSDGDDVADAKDAFPQDSSRWKITLGMENALDAAYDYLDFQAFSRQGLIDQLSSKFGSGFKLDEATWAVNQLEVDWRQEAVKAAKDYLDFSSFSRQGLIDQLSSPYGSQFTVAEAVYAVNKLGL